VASFLQQFFNGLVSGAFLALLALGLSVIFGMLRVVNFAHGAFYMLGAFGAYILLTDFGVSFWLALILVPVALAVLGMVIERLLIHRLTALDPLYNFLLTFGLTLVLQDLMRREYGITSQPYPQPAGLDEPVDLGLFEYPGYQVFVLAVAALTCAGVWLLLTRTRVGMVVRASTEKPELTRALGINVGAWVTPVFGFGVALDLMTIRSATLSDVPVILELIRDLAEYERLSDAVSATEDKLRETLFGERPAAERPEARRVGKECREKRRSRGAPDREE
jgi:branched-chain amino acid transport system permease protein